VTIKDPAGLAWFGRNMLLTLLGKELTEILSEKKTTENHGFGPGYCAENHESNYQTRLGAFKRRTGQCLTVPLKENRGKNQKACYSTVKNFTKKSSIQMKKNLQWRKLSIS